MKNWLWAIIAFAFIIRIGYVLATPAFVPQGDGAGYFAEGTYLYLHHHLMPAATTFGGDQIHGTLTHYPDANWPPLYPIFLAAVLELNHLVSFLGVGAVEATRLAEVLIGTVAVGLVAMIALRLFGRRVAVASAAVAAVLPTILYVGASDLSQALSGPLMVAAVAAVVEYRRLNRTWLLLAAGALTGLAALTHTDGLVLVLPLVVAVWPRHGSIRSRLRAPVLVVLSVVVVLAPWTIRNAVKFHTFVPLQTSTGETLAGVYNARAQSLPVLHWIYPASYPPDAAIYVRNKLQTGQDTALQAVAFRYIAAHPLSLLRTLYWNTRRLLGIVPTQASAATARILDVSPTASLVGLIIFWIVAALALIGCFSRAVRTGEKWIWLVPLCLYIPMALLSTLWPRFQAPVDPYVAVLAGAGISAILGMRPDARGESRTYDLAQQPLQSSELGSVTLADS